jgi:hypothetical protein
MRRELTKSARRGGASAPRPNFCFGPWTLILKKTRGTFFAFFSSRLFFLWMQPLLLPFFPLCAPIEITIYVIPAVLPMLLRLTWDRSSLFFLCSSEFSKCIVNIICTLKLRLQMSSLLLAQPYIIYMPHWCWVFSKLNADNGCCHCADIMKVNDFHLLSNSRSTVSWSLEVSSFSSRMLMVHSQLQSTLHKLHYYLHTIPLCTDTGVAQDCLGHHK